MTDETRPTLANIDAEQGLLGAILVNNEAMNNIRVPIEPDHFAEPVHARIFEAARSMIAAGRLASPVTLLNYFQNDPALKELKIGAKYLARLAAAAASIINAPDYALAVFDLYLRRQAIARASAAVDDLYSLPVDQTPADYISQLALDLTELSDDYGAQGRTSFSAEAAASAAIDSTAVAIDNDGKRPDVVLTGIKSLDERIGGFVPGTLVIVGARPSMGKTALGLTFAIAAANNGIGAQFISLEMGAKQLGDRMLSMLARPRRKIPFSQIEWGKISGDDFAFISDIQRSMKELPLIVEDRSDMNIAAIRSAVARAKVRLGKKLKLVVVDYLGLIKAGQRYAGRRVDEVTEISVGLKNMAKQLGVCVVALVQLSRALEGRDNKRPTMADLRDSGAIEQDADIVLFPFRQAYYLVRELETVEPDSSAYITISDDLKKLARLMEIIVAKNRQGPTGTARAWCDIECNYIAMTEPLMQGVMAL